MSEFIKYQGNIAGTGSVSRAGARVPLITTDKEPGAEGGREGGSSGEGWGSGGGGGGGGGRRVKALLETLVLIRGGGPSGPGAGGVEGRTQRRQSESRYTEVTWKDGKHGRET